jgi:hypothetical protein
MIPNLRSQNDVVEEMEENRSNVIDSLMATPLNLISEHDGVQ